MTLVWTVIVHTECAFECLMNAYFCLKPTNEGFYNCLDTWNTFLDYLDDKLKDRSTNSAAIVARYCTHVQILILSWYKEVWRYIEFILLLIVDTRKLYYPWCPICYTNSSFATTSHSWRNWTMKFWMMM